MLPAWLLSYSTYYCFISLSSVVCCCADGFSKAHRFFRIICVFSRIMDKVFFLKRKCKGKHKPSSALSAEGVPPPLPYAHCLNCGTELKGRFCHVCGQEAVHSTPTVRSFIAEYAGNAYNWDAKFVRTFWTLISRPGQLTRDFLSGRFSSQEHPLKLNMFLLFVFVPLFVLFRGTEKMTDAVQGLTDDDRIFSGVQLGLLMDDEAYAARMQECPRDTVCLLAPLVLAESHPQCITHLETRENTQGKGLDKWVAVLPRVLIEDGVIVMGDDGYYRFSRETSKGKDELALFNAVWAEMVAITSQYFPMLLLLTAPFLSVSLKLVQRRSRLPGIHHFIFALHYTAFLEFLMICIYVLHLTVAPPMRVLEWIMAVGSCAYLTVAFRNVYAPCAWGKAVVKSLLTSLIYSFILLMIFITIFFIACCAQVD